MAEITGYSEYSCDVQGCGRRDYAQPDTDRADAYVTRSRITDDGVHRELMLCAEHNATYAKLVGECERAYIAFEKDGSYTLATQAEVDELQAQLAQLQANYEALRKNRDHWVTKYNELSAEYERYKRDHPEAEGGEE